ncbi:MAG TPA: thioredoxin [Acidimicrobiales bacterium]|jgi:thioredoxin 1|nr:thioredoxin [Acidimicrobiales bacterium]
MTTTITELTEETFDEEVGASDVPLVVDFWAEWCGPCRMVAPVLEQIAAENAGRLRVAKLDVDDAPGIARRFQIMSIPTLMVFQDGVAKKRLVGAKGKSQLLSELAEFL